MRPRLESIYMDFARSLALRSTCSRLQVGTVITNRDMAKVLAIGYNGNAKGFPNQCDREEPGNCGDVHSEANALVKLSPEPGMIAFITHAPCAYCAKLLVNAGVEKVFYESGYRDRVGIDILVRAGIWVANSAAIME